MHSKSMLKLSAFGILAIALSAGVARAQSSGQGRVVATSGQVYINGQPAKVGDLVPAGAKVETESGGTATLIFGSESVVHVAASSVVDVERVNGNAVTVSVAKGSVDGVKKISTETAHATETIVVKTNSAVFELKSGRYSVGMKEAGAGVSNSFVAVDGNATLTYTTNTRSGQKAGSTVELSEGAFVLVRPSSGASGGVVASAVTQTETESNQHRPSQQEAPKVDDTIRTITDAIINPEVPLGETMSRSPSATSDSSASTNRGAGAEEGTREGATPGASGGSASDVDWGRGAGMGSPLSPGVTGGIPRDPLQPLPGLTNPNVTIVFEP